MVIETRPDLFCSQWILASTTCQDAHNLLEVIFFAGGSIWGKQVFLISLENTQFSFSSFFFTRPALFRRRSRKHGDSGMGKYIAFVNIFLSCKLKNWLFVRYYCGFGTYWLLSFYPFFTTISVTSLHFESDKLLSISFGSPFLHRAFLAVLQHKRNTVFLHGRYRTHWSKLTIFTVILCNPKGEIKSLLRKFSKSRWMPKGPLEISWIMIAQQYYRIFSNINPYVFNPNAAKGRRRHTSPEENDESHIFPICSTFSIDSRFFTFTVHEPTL